MPICDHHHARSRRQPVGDLAPLAEMIDDAFDDLTAGAPAHLLRVITDPAAPDEIELGLLALPAGGHPTDALLGFVAPPEWAAVGAVSTGHQRSPDEPEQEPVPVRVTYLLDSAGRAACLLSALAPGGAPAHRRRVEEPLDGGLPDACRRVLGMATSPPSIGPEVWLATRWLDRLLAEALAEPGRLTTWSQAAATHPLVGRGPTPSPSAVAELVDTTVEAFGWERMRRLAADGRGDSAQGIDPDVAAWMDAGFFSRWLLSAELAPSLLLTELAALLPSPVLGSVVEALPSSLARP